MTSTPSARNRAQSHFRSSEYRQGVLRDEMEMERAATVAKTARLKALRLAKEADDKVEADRLAAAKAAEDDSNTAQKSAKAARRRQS